MAGNQVRGLVAVSKARGWDPTVIPGVGSIANFDHDQGNYPMGSVGSLPDGENLSWPDGYDVPALKMNPFPGPDVSREVERDRTNNSNPYPGFPNGSY
jgi:hypothetical protein